MLEGCWKDVGWVLDGCLLDGCWMGVGWMLDGRLIQDDIILGFTVHALGCDSPAQHGNLLREAGLVT